MADDEAANSPTETTTNSEAPTPDAAAEVKPLHATKLSTLLESGKYSDLTLQCGTRKWKAHKSVLCIQSDFFAKACDGGFKEAQSNVIDLSEDDEHAVAAMVYFMYHGSYDANTILPESERVPRTMQLHVRVVGLAQKYFIQPLQVFARDRAVAAMESWEGAPSIFADAVYEVYTGTTNSDVGATLREHAVSVAIDNATIIFSADDTEGDRRTREILIDETPGFVGDWATAMSNCNSTQASTINNLTAVNDTLNTDNAKLDANVKRLESASATSTNYVVQLHKEKTSLQTQLNSMPFKRPVEPTRPDGSIDPVPECYLCPNCEAYFLRSIRIGGEFHHMCYDSGWKGKLGKSGYRMTYNEWQRHIARNTPKGP